MTDERSRIVEAAVQLLGQDTAPLLERIADCEGGLWYLGEKIVKVSDADTRLDNTRVLKYAYNFARGGGNVTFVREGDGRTPDLLVAVAAYLFHVEVKKFRMPEGNSSAHSVEKVVTAVEDKRHQLPKGQIGFVAIDNFDIHLEPGFGYDVIAEALCEIERLASANPNGWRVPSGVIIAASTTSGSTLPIEFPHFVWTNPSADPALPSSLSRWTRSASPGGRTFDCSEHVLESSDRLESQALMETLEF